MNGREANQYINDHKEVVGLILKYPHLSFVNTDLLHVIPQKLNIMGRSKKRSEIENRHLDTDCAGSGERHDGVLALHAEKQTPQLVPIKNLEMRMVVSVSIALNQSWKIA